MLLCVNYIAINLTPQNLLGSINCTLGTAEEKINKLEVKAVENMQTEVRRKAKKKNFLKYEDLWDNIKQSKIYVKWSPKRKRASEIIMTRNDFIC